MNGNIAVNEHENAVVIYDKDGVIRHVHNVVSIGDLSDSRSSGDIEKVALQVAEQFGHDVKELKTLTVKAADLKKGKMRMRVDISNLDLVPDERTEKQ